MLLYIGLGIIILWILGFIAFSSNDGPDPDHADPRSRFNHSVLHSAKTPGPIASVSVRDAK
jgi:hypothetical protein